MVYVYPFQTATIADQKLVWAKGFILQGYDPDVWRYDMCGALMKFSEHGNRNSDNGWEIDHVMPQALGGSNNLGNLQPLNWKHNAAKSDTYPWKCGR